ncbi:MAG TPA: TIGR03435 family protein, partial [Bryobacteraceae bacterium]
HQIVGGPEWLDAERWMITAKADHPAGDHELMVLLQGLMSDRFKLTLHQDKRTMPAYLLEVAKSGPKLEKSAGGSSTNTTGTKLRASIDARNTSMNQLAELLARMMDLPVVNQTGLEGAFNFKLEWVPEKAREGGDVDGPSIYTAIQEQLGLRLHADKAPVDVIVIDHVEMPSEN